MPNYPTHSNDGVAYEATTKFACPICGAPCSAGVSPQPFVLHANPPCRVYVKLPLLEFMSLAAMSAEESRH